MAALSGTELRPAPGRECRAAMRAFLGHGRHRFQWLDGPERFAVIRIDQFQVSAQQDGWTVAQNATDAASVTVERQELAGASVTQDVVNPPLPAHPFGQALQLVRPIAVGYRTLAPWHTPQPIDGLGLEGDDPSFPGFCRR